MELFEQIQAIAAKIKATGNLTLLENDKEYVVPMSKHLSKEGMWRWWEKDISRVKQFLSLHGRNRRDCQEALNF